MRQYYRPVLVVLVRQRYLAVLAGLGLLRPVRLVLLLLVVPVRQYYRPVLEVLAGLHHLHHRRRN